MDIEIQIPESASFIINELMKNGFAAFVVGGCVRDSILGIEPKDWDICTSANPEQTMRVFKGLHIIETGLKHGTVTIMIYGEPFEVTTFRVDGNYSDGRRPDSVSFVTDIRKDLARRDFTINAMAYNNSEGLVDPFDGLSDLHNRVIRGVGNADDRIKEDALRMMRALRFSARFGFTISPVTIDAIFDNAAAISHVSAERFSSELTKILMSDHPEILNSHCATELLKNFIPGFFKCDTWNINDRLKKDICTRLAFFFGGFSDIEKVLRFLKFDNDTISDAVKIHTLVNNYEMKSEAILMRRLISKFGFYVVKCALSIYGVRGNSNYQMYELVAKIKHDGDCVSLSQLAINGDDVSGVGYEGAHIGQILRNALSAVIVDPSLNTYKTLMGMLKEYKI